MSFIDGLNKRMLNACKVARLGMSKNLLHVGKQIALIVFECENIVSIAVDNPFSNLFLTANCIYHDAALKFEQLNQLRSCGNLIRFGIDFALPQHGMIYSCPNTNQVDWRFGIGWVVGLSQRFAINRDYFFTT